MPVRFAITALLCMGLMQAGAVDVSNRYRSPRNPERRIRQTTELIVLHTTEAPARSSLNKLSERGEAHYCVTEDGSVYRIVDRDREAFHAGRSMWNGKEDVDKFSIGIECVGYHDKPMGAVQLTAIRDLVKQLKAMYKLSDDKVVCHSHVAYGMPNKWHPKKHRGRKQCGMLFAMPSVRKVLELKSKPTVDRDVKARRLVVGDTYLQKVLYGKVDTMVGKVSASKAEDKPKRGGLMDWLKLGSSKPEPPKAVVKTKPSPPPKAVVKAKPQPAPKSVSELRSRGFVLKGVVGKGNAPSRIAGAKWNAPDTYYTIRNKVIPGNAIDPQHIEVGMGVWVRK